MMSAIPFATPFAARIRTAGISLMAAAALAVAALPAAAQAVEKPAPLTAEAQAIKKALEQKFPGGDIRGVVKTPYFGLYEVQFDDRVLYTDAKAKYLLVGSVYDTESKTNLTEDRQRKLNRVDVSKLPLDLAIKRVKGTGERTMVIFSDADCPFCAKLEQELKNVDNITTYTFLFPIDQLHPDSARKSRAIWCAADRAKAWDAFFDNGALPDNKGDCGDPIAQTAALGAKFKVTATPTLLFADGTLVPGAIPASRIDTELKSADAELKKITAAKK